MPDSTRPSPSEGVCPTCGEPPLRPRIELDCPDPCHRPEWATPDTIEGERERWRVVVELDQRRYEAFKAMASLTPAEIVSANRIAPSPEPSLEDQDEHCQSCGRQYGYVWAAENPMWNAVVGDPMGTRCLDCFDREARAAGFSPYISVHDGHYVIEKNHHPAPPDTTPSEERPKACPDCGSTNNACREAQSRYIREWKRAKRAEEAR